MIPIRDTISSKNYPIVNNVLIGINVLVYLIQMGQQGALDRFIYIYGLVPARYSIAPISAYFSTGQQLFSLVSFMFLHGGFWHLLGNMWSLYIFGDNVEDDLGHVRYLLFYILCGLTSGLSHMLLNFQSNVPTIGASGAIAGVMGAYFLLYPGSKILTLIPIIFIPYFIELPAYLFLGFWFVFQFISAAGSRGEAAGIAWWAHIGGFIFGMVFLKIFGALPRFGLSEKVSRFTRRKKTPRLQVIRPVGSGNDPHLYGIIKIASYEAFGGTRKLVNIPWGFKNRFFRVTIPKAIQEGGRLRLKGQGKDLGDGRRGDLFLKVIIEHSNR
jgi:membrane associated rhomboid family serine protease